MCRLRDQRMSADDEVAMMMKELEAQTQLFQLFIDENQRFG